jgi:hypothetical protein
MPGASKFPAIVRCYRKWRRGCDRYRALGARGRAGNRHETRWPRAGATDRAYRADLQGFATTCSGAVSPLRANGSQGACWERAPALRASSLVAWVTSLPCTKCRHVADADLVAAFVRKQHSHPSPKALARLPLVRGWGSVRELVPGSDRASCVWRGAGKPRDRAASPAFVTARVRWSRCDSSNWNPRSAAVVQACDAVQ